MYRWPRTWGLVRYDRSIREKLPGNSDWRLERYFCGWCRLEMAWDDDVGVSQGSKACDGRRRERDFINVCTVASSECAIDR